MARKTWMSRAAGVLLPVSSLPSKYGIGTFGQAAREWVDFLARAKQRYWQVLPLGPTSFGDSPYQSYSAFAGSSLYIDLEYLCRQGLLKKGLMLLVVLVSALLDRAMGAQAAVCRDAVCWFYIANEGLSLLENLAQAGAPFPERIRELLGQKRDEADGAEPSENEGRGEV